MATPTVKEPRQALPPSTPVFRLGKKTFALEMRDWQGKPQATLTEVSPLVDPKELKVTGWNGVFGGMRLSAAPDELRDFLSGVRGAITDGLRGDVQPRGGEVRPTAKV